MKIILYRYCLAYLLILLIATACSKNVTHYYPDANMPGVAIFSNTGNNVMTCFVDGSSWRTLDRITGNGNISELQIRRRRTSSLLDTITINWRSNNLNQYDIMLTLPVAKNFSWKDFSSFAGRRIAIDSSNGYISLNQDIYQILKGKGSIYFNTSYIDSVSFNNIQGRIAGLLQADFQLLNAPAISITSGRFDDNIGPSELPDY